MIILNKTIKLYKKMATLHWNLYLLTFDCKAKSHSDHCVYYLWPIATPHSDRCRERFQRWGSSVSNLQGWPVSQLVWQCSNRLFRGEPPSVRPGTGLQGPKTTSNDIIAGKAEKGFSYENRSIQWHVVIWWVCPKELKTTQWYLQPLYLLDDRITMLM